MKNTILFMLCLSVLLSSCQEDTQLASAVDQHFFIEREDAIMPVFVRGNTLSKAFVLYVHGGPGGGSIGLYNLELFKTLEEKYAMVYWDQRCAGSSQGNCNSEELQVAAYVQDLDLLLETLYSRYGADIDIFLMGHSWGGTLTLSYLTTSNLQQKVSGAIITGGVHNFPLFIQAAQDRVGRFAEQQIILGNEVSEWQDIKASISQLDLGKLEDWTKLNKLSYQAQQLLVFVDSIAPYPVSDSESLQSIFLSPDNLFAALLNNEISAEVMWEQLQDYDLSDQIRSISIPVSLLWGHFDCVVPPEVGEDLHSLLEQSNGELIFFPKSDHSLPFSNEIEAFSRSIIEFVETHR